MDNLFNTFSADNHSFCLIQKQDSDEIQLLTGVPHRSRLLGEIPRRRGPSGGGRVYDTISIVPFCQIREKGCIAHDAGEQILTIEVTGQQLIAMDELPAPATAQAGPITMAEAIRYDTTAEEYAAVIKRVIDREIGNGEGANFVIPRNATGRIAGFSLDTALAIFRHLVANDYGTYWKFLFMHEDRVFIGSTPERHLSVEKGRVRMNPISGTFRKSAGHRSRSLLKNELLAFINDRKEINELFMVVDEELKMMARMCEKGGAIIGPLLKEMSRLVHSEYLLAGDTDKDIFELFRDSMFAATVIGSPVENACTIIARYTGSSRRYYGSALLLVGRDEDGGDFLDSPITIRTAEIEHDGSLHFSVGATLVKDSIPEEEVKETEAKASVILAGILGDGGTAISPPLLPRLAGNDDIIEGLLARNEDLSHFWFFRQGGRQHATPARSPRLTLIHNEDDFIYMLRHILRALGMQTAIVPWSRYEIGRDDADITLVGPGPGNPNDGDSPKIAGNMTIVRKLLQRRRSVLCICFGHQILCRTLGFKVEKRRVPLQGSQEEIDLFGKREKVGFYNTFAAKKGDTTGEFETAVLPGSDEVIAIRGGHFSGFQFHPESILSRNGCDILREEIYRLLREARRMREESI
jgi:phenazine biosynthesis protein phzE